MTFSSWLCAITRGAPRNAGKVGPAPFRSPHACLQLRVERLEERRLLSATVDFAAAETFATGGTGPRSVAVADFNSDGRNDLAVANIDSFSPVGTVGVLLGNEAGGFDPAVTFASGAYQPRSVAVADFNNDGKADLAIGNNGTNLGAGIVGVLMGDGNGGFAPATRIALDGDVEVGDLNNDGNADLVGMHLTSHTVRVRLGNGAGGFAPTTSFASGGFFPVSATIADLNNDGRGDIAVANQSGGRVGVLLGNGSGGFATTSYLTGGTTAGSVAVADFNNDGKADLVVANGGSVLSVLLGDGLGAFAPAVAYASGNNNAFSVAVADFNADGNADVALTDTNTHTVGVLLGDGAGGFATATPFASGGVNPGSVVVGDFNSDGKPDVALANSGSNTVGVLLNTTITNQPPVNTVPGRQVAAEDVLLVISGLSVADDDAAGVLTVTFSVTQGTLSVGPVSSGVSPSGISGNGTAVLSLTGTQSQINATLGSTYPGGLYYKGSKDFSGLDTLTMTTSDAGGLADVDTVSIDVLSARQQIDLLVAVIVDLAEEGVLSEGIANSLIATLRAVFSPILTSAIGVFYWGSFVLESFTRFVTALVQAEDLTVEQGDELIQAAQSIRASLA